MKQNDKTKIMILGSPHLANPGMDGINLKIDDILAPRRQSEIEFLVSQLKEFRPTKIALEIDERFYAETQKNYQGYLSGTYELKRGEGDQIGFRLAKLMGHPKVYCVDYWKEHDPILDKIDDHLIDDSGFAKTHNQKHFLNNFPKFSIGKVTKNEDGTIWIESDKDVSIIDLYIRRCDREIIRGQQQAYLRMARIGLGDEYPGANWLAHIWYARNLKIFVNITRINESDDDRILYCHRNFRPLSKSTLWYNNKPIIRSFQWQNVEDSHPNLRLKLYLKHLAANVHRRNYAVNIISARNNLQGGNDTSLIMQRLSLNQRINRPMPINNALLNWNNLLVS